MQAQQPQQTTTLTQKMEFTASLALFPAMTIMVFTHRKVGYRFLSPIKLLIMTVLLITVGTVSGMAVPFTVFAVAMLAFGLIKRRTRWSDLKMGIPWHTYSRGYPWLDVIPLPESIIRRYINPAAVVGIGAIMALLFHWLGIYLIFAAMCLYLFEGYDYDRNLNRQLDVMDSLVESEFVSDDAAYFLDSSQTRERSVVETGGIPTGVSGDLAAAIAKRRTRTTSPSWQQSPPVPGQIGGAPPVTPMQGYPAQYPPSPQSYPLQGQQGSPDNLPY